MINKAINTLKEAMKNLSLDKQRKLIKTWSSMERDSKIHFFRELTKEKIPYELEILIDRLEKYSNHFFIECELNNFKINIKKDLELTKEMYQHLNMSYI